ncbi:MFS transporter [Streptacidiphilus monticola]
MPLSGGGLVGLVYGIKAAARDGAAQPSVWIAVGLGALLLALFVRRQQRIPNPLLDLRLFRAPAFTGSIAANLFTIVALSAQSLAFSLYFQDVRGYDPMGTGFALLLGPAGAVVSGPLTPLAIQKLGRARTAGLGLALMSLSCCGYLLVGAGTDYWLLALPMLVSGAGIGFTMGVTSDTVLASAPKEKAGVAGAVGETAMELGGALGIAVLGSVLTAGYRGDLRLPAGLPSAAADAAHESLAGAVGAAASLPGDSPGAWWPRRSRRT